MGKSELALYYRVCTGFVVTTIEIKASVLLLSSFYQPKMVFKAIKTASDAKLNEHKDKFCYYCVDHTAQ